MVEKEDVYFLVYPPGSFNAQLPDRNVIRPVEGDGWSLDDAQEIARKISAQTGINVKDLKLVGSFGNKVPLISELGQDNS